MKTKTIMLAFAVSQLFLSSCKKQTGPEGAQGPQGNPGPVLSGNLKGFVNHYDVNGAKLLSGLAGDTLMIENSNMIAITDASGAYTFSNVTTGTYNVYVKRAGFGDTKIQSIQFSGGGDTYRNTAISKIPTMNVLAVNSTANNILGVNNILISGTIAPVPYQQTIALFFGNPNATTSSASINDYSILYTVNVNANATTFSKNVPTIDLYDANFASANTLAVAAYIVGANTNASSYNDLTSNKTVYTAISPSPIVATTLVQ